MAQTNKEYMVMSSSSSKTQQGKDFCSLKLRNEQEELSMSVWDISPDKRPAVGDLVLFKKIQDKNGFLSANSGDMVNHKAAMPGHPLYDLLPRPIPQEQWQQVIARLQELSEDDTLKVLIADLAKQFFAPYAKYPAAKSMHHAFPGGLLNHTYQMLSMLAAIAPGLPYPVRVDHCALAILFHDYGKVYEYNESGDIQPDYPLLGHIFISANRLYGYLKEKGVDEEQRKRIVHIVLAHHGTHDFGSPVLPATKEAILVHALDNLSAKMDAHEGTPHMDKCYALDTNAVK